MNKEIQELLDQQQKMAHKWKDEIKQTSKNYELIVEEMQVKLQRADSRCLELQKTNAHLNVIKDEFSRQIEDSKKVSIHL